MTNKRWTAPEVIAYHYSTDVADVRDGRYHYGHTSRPVYVFDGDYYCAAKKGQKPAKLDGEDHWKWEVLESPTAEKIGWTIWIQRV